MHRRSDVDDMNERVKKILMGYLAFIVLGVLAGIVISLIAGLPEPDAAHGGVEAPAGDQASANEHAE